jgi:GNAT superfamily N-acetyltransferase
MIEIRPASEADTPLIHTFIRELADFERLLEEAPVTEELLRRNLFGPDPHAEVLIANWNGEPAGFALFFYNFSTFLGKPGIYLEDLFVRERLRGKGIGKALMEHLARLAVARGCGRLEWAALNWNEQAIGFYKKLGAVPMNEWTVFRLTGRELESFGAAQAAS